jgi:hypothetical protein
MFTMRMEMSQGPRILRDPVGKIYPFGNERLMCVAEMLEGRLREGFVRIRQLMVSPRHK